MPPRESAMDAVRAALLPETVAHARARSPFWRERLERAGGRFEGLPPLTKSEAIDAGEALYAEGFDRARDRIVLSSGTRREGGRVLRVRRQPAEEEALGAFLASAARAAGAATAAAPPVVVELWNVWHGLPPGPPPARTFRAPWMPHENFLEMALAALADAAAAGEGRIDAVRGSVSALLALAALARRKGVALDRFGVRAVGTNSYEATPRTRRLLHEAFGAEVAIVDSFSLSELPAPAPECAACGAHHFGIPPLVAELFAGAPGALAPAAWEPGRVGHLVVTGLVPFVQRTPLLRYDTGDLVRATGWCDAAGDEGFRVLGRSADAVRALVGGEPRAVLFPSDLQRIVDDLPGVARAEHPLERMGVLPPSGLGPPKVLGRGAAGGRAVQVDLALEPGVEAAARAATTEALRAALLAASEDLRALLADGGRLDVRAVHPATIADSLFKR